MAFKACLVLVFSTAVAEDVLVREYDQKDQKLLLAVNSHGSFEEILPSQDMILRKQNGGGEADVVTNDRAFAAVDASGELSLTRTRELDIGDVETEAFAKPDTPEKKPEALVKKHGGGSGDGGSGRNGGDGGNEDGHAEEDEVMAAAEVDADAKIAKAKMEADASTAKVTLVDGKEDVDDTQKWNTRDLDIGDMETEAFAKPDTPETEPKAFVEKHGGGSGDGGSGRNEGDGGNEDGHAEEDEVLAAAEVDAEPKIANAQSKK